ncbi:SprT-like family-domain-containing protein [Jackrogersella minutella]|nr:SprT-like family-domain-containing protein [Jackrogersella minutella]
MLGALGDSSDDEFPDVDVVVRRYRQKVLGRGEEKGRNDEVNSRDKIKLGSTREHDVKKEPEIKATPLRRRKLGQGQTMDGSLLKPWGETATTKDVDSRASKPRASRLRVGGTQARTEAESSSRNASERMPARVRQPSYRAASAGTNQKPLPKEDKKTERNVKGKGGDEKHAQVYKEPTRNPLLLDESNEESDVLEDIPQSSEEDESEFISESDSETDAWNSDSDTLATRPVRRSRSPTAEWAVPQRPLFKDLRNKAAPGNKQSHATSSDPTKRGASVIKTKKASQPGNLEDAFQKLLIFNEDSEPDEPSVKEGKKPILEPATPKKKLPPPVKTPKIPTSPWKPEHKEFWEPEVHFGWVDQHSPEKKPESPKKTAKEVKAETKRKYAMSPEKRDERKAFEAVKEELARSFLKELDDRVTGGRLAELTEDTGGLQIKWSSTLLSTAGRANWKCKTLTTTSRGEGGGGQAVRSEKRQHSAYIELAHRVLSNESDLLNTVAHEFCHLAVFILHGKPKAAHGAEFKAWGARCGREFAGRGIAVTTKHNYAIEYKFIWKCAGCPAEVKRHGRSVDPTRQRCGHCRGQLVQVKPTPRGAPADPETGAAPKRKLTAWQEFMGREMKALSQTNPGMSFKARMAVVSARWAEVQKTQKGREEKREETIRQLGTAVEVLNIDDDDDDKKVESEPKDKEGDNAKYDIFS